MLDEDLLVAWNSKLLKTKWLEKEQSVENYTDQRSFEEKFLMVNVCINARNYGQI